MLTSVFHRQRCSQKAVPINCQTLNSNRQKEHKRNLKVRLILPSLGYQFNNLKRYRHLQLVCLGLDKLCDASPNSQDNKHFYQSDLIVQRNCLSSNVLEAIVQHKAVLGHERRQEHASMNNSTTAEVQQPCKQVWRSMDEFYGQIMIEIYRHIATSIVLH